MHDVLAHSLDDPEARSQPAWRAVAFRFAFLYWMLLCIYVDATEIYGFDWIGEAIAPAINVVVQWVGHHILGISYEFSGASNGSGDKTYDWVWLFTIAAAAVIGALAWTSLDRRRAHDARLRGLLRVVLRYTLVLILLGYGVGKLFFGQFPPPTVGRLMQRYGDSSPMGLLWTFMGASPAYVFFSGAGETLGAVLLLFRRTTTLGALVLGAVLTNVVMLNFCYDVPVKINSAHYLAMCLYLAAPDLRRLANVFVLHRPTQPAFHPLVLGKRWMRIGRVILKYGAVCFVVYKIVRAELTPRPDSNPAWYLGSWEVTSFRRDGQDVPPLITDATRWRYIRFYPGLVRWRFMDDSPGDPYGATVDETAHTVTLKPIDDQPKHPTGEVVLHYERIDDKHLKLEGKVGSEALVVEVQLFDHGSMLLVTRGFHWINEVPFNQ